MKRILLSAVALISLSNVMAQGPVVTDTVITGAGYATNVWYSLRNDEQGSRTSSEWDIALASSFSQTGSLTSSILFNSKIGKVYAIPNSDPATSFDTLSSVNFSALTNLVNDDSDWGIGALRRASNANQFDYGWGTYNQVSHSVMGSKVFVVQYTDNSTKKFYVNMITMQGKYEIISADLANGAPHTTQDVTMAPYSTKNFVYYKINTNTIVDREPVSSAWDFTFLQYDATISPTMQYMSFGILNNVGVEAVKVTGVTDVDAFDDYQTQTFTDAANAIGYNWKNAQAQTVPNDVVYFVKAKDGNTWKLVFTQFTSGAAGSNMNVFKKQNLTTLGLNEAENNLFVEIYPNPARDLATVILDTKGDTKIQVVSMNGSIVSEMNVGAGFQKVELNTADLNNGVYFVNVVNANNATTQRLVVQH
ncbi:hypothetical protein D3C87_431700 [compost metagenome]